MIKKVDDWIGKTLFIPPIIKVCQIFGITTYVLGEYVTISGSIGLLVIISYKDFVDYLIAAFITVTLIGCILRVYLYRELFEALHHDRSDTNFDKWWRVLTVMMWIISFLAAVTIPAVRLIILSVCIFLAAVAAYCNLVKIIPPKEDKKESKKLVDQLG